MICLTSHFQTFEFRSHFPHLFSILRKQNFVPRNMLIFINLRLPHPGLSQGYGKAACRMCDGVSPAVYPYKRHDLTTPRING